MVLESIYDLDLLKLAKESRNIKINGLSFFLKRYFFSQVDDLDEKLDRLLFMYEDDRKKMLEQQQQIVVAAAAAAGQAVANHAALSNSGRYIFKLKH